MKRVFAAAVVAVAALAPSVGSADIPPPPPVTAEVDGPVAELVWMIYGVMTGKCEDSDPFCRHP